jgi:hypothetical protein
MTMEAKYKMMTEQLRLTNSDEEVGNYLRWIITSDTAKEYWKNNLLNQGAVMVSCQHDYKLPSTKNKRSDEL